MPSVPDFTLRDWQASHTGPGMLASILDGKGASMPAWRGRLSPDQARELVGYLRSFCEAELPKADEASSDFRTRLRLLQKQFEELEKQHKALSNP
jgi:hypothetical protein